MRRLDQAMDNLKIVRTTEEYHCVYHSHRTELFDTERKVVKDCMHCPVG